MRLRRRKGSAVVETALMMPWLIFLFVGVFDFGFYSYAAIATENASRAAAILAASDSTLLGSSKLCTAALSELNMLPNVGTSMTTCLSSDTNLSDANPVAVMVNKLCKTGCTAVCADCAINAAATSVRAIVAYRTIPLIPIPGSMTSKTTITRIVEVRSN